MQDDDRTSRVGRTIAERYVLDAEIGRGAMGTVYSATHVLNGAPVAVKLLDATPDRAVAARIVEEARAAARLKHKNLVEVLDAGIEEDGSAYLILELLNGETLEMLLAKTGALLPEEALNVLGPIMNALGMVHRQGLVHRDVKPANIFLHRDPKDRLVPKLLDLGIAKEIGPAGMLAKNGVLTGQPHYLAPEQVGGGTISAATDVWAMGVVLYRCLSGQYAFSGENAVAVMTAIGTGRFKALHKAAPGVSYALAEAIDRAIVVEANDRPQDLDAYQRALQASQSTPRPHEGSKAAVSPLPRREVVSNTGEVTLIAFTGIGLALLGGLAFQMESWSKVQVAPAEQKRAALLVPRKQLLGQLPQSAVLEREVVREAPKDPPPVVKVKEEPATIALVERPVEQVEKPVAPPPVERLPETAEPKKSGKKAYETALAAKARGDRAAALRSLDEAIALSPDFVAAYNVRGLLYQETNKLDLAIADFSTAITRDPGNASLYNNRALAAKARGDHKSAIADLTRALELDKKQPLFYLHRGQAHLAAQDREKAIADFTAAINGGEPSAYFHRGIALQEAGQHDRAVADFDLVIKKEARPEAYYRRGRSQLDLGKPQAAVDDLSRVITQDPKHANAYLRRGYAFIRLDRPIEAQRDLRRFLELDPKSSSRESVLKQLAKLEKP